MRAEEYPAEEEHIKEDLSGFLSRYNNSSISGSLFFSKYAALFEATYYASVRTIVLGFRSYLSDYQFGWLTSGGQ